MKREIQIYHQVSMAQHQALILSLSLAAFETWDELPPDERKRIWPRLSEFNRVRLLTGMIHKRDLEKGIRRIYAKV